jgi:alcohol dehydrogenase
VLGVCFEEVERIGLRELSDPVIEEPTDAIVRVDLAGLCGSDLHPFFGREQGIDVGTVMGHEFVGQVVAVGDAVSCIAEGDRVCAPFTTNCGHCFYCRDGLTSRCENGQLFGWREKGVGLHGGQAQYIRVPWADGTLMRIPQGVSDETALLLGDNLSTGHFAAELAGIQPGGTYAVIGCGTVGLLAIAATMQRNVDRIVAVEPNASRRRVARRLGAMAYSDAQSAAEAMDDLTAGRGADAVMELVGLPEAQQLAYRLIRSGGTMSVIGCHCTPHFSFSPADAYNKNLTYRTGRCPARHSMPKLAAQLAREPLDLSWCITHRFGIADAEKAYQTFAYAQEDCVKAVLQL